MMVAAQELALLREMLLIRRFEERLASLYAGGAIPGFVHLYIGQEAVAVGVSAALAHGDRVVSNHRGHGHALARGVDPGRLLAEICGRREGCNGGKGGTLHIADVGSGFFGANGIVGAGIPLATGLALADSFHRRDRVSVSFFGDGATNAGVFYEALNLAALWRLPVVYVCENNRYSELTAFEELTALASVAKVADCFGFPGVAVDGNDVREIRRVAGDAVDRARAGGGPTLIEAATYRLAEHAEGLEEIAGSYRSDDEMLRWAHRDPITVERERLLGDGVPEGRIGALQREVAQIVQESVAFAERAPFPDPREALEDVWA